jgi:hypothetical protein
MLGWLKRAGAPPVFEERADHERGFAAHFAAAIAPGLLHLEHLRRLVLVAFWLVLAIGLPAAAALGWVALEHDGRLLKPAVVVLAGTLGLAILLLGWFSGREERLLLPAICRHLGDFAVLVRPKLMAEAIAPFRALGLVPPLPPRQRLAWRAPRERVIAEDLFTGRHRGIGLWMAELDDVQKQSGSDTRLFRGTLIALELAERARGAAPWRVRAADPADVGRLTVEPADAAAPARGELASPALVAALGALARTFAPTSFAGACDGTTVRLALAFDGRSRPFDVGHPFQPVYRCEPAVRATLAQLAAVRAVMDALADAAGTAVRRH